MTPSKKKTKSKTLHAECGSESKHPDHTSVLPRLRRVEGQLRGISEMITSERYCVDILTQVRAATSALRSVEMEIFQKHLRSCVKEALTIKDVKKADEKIEELVQLLLRRGIN